MADIRYMADVVEKSTSRQRFNMWLMSIFGGAALLLASIGVYGLMSHSVQQRTQEIGIRLALGAQTGDVRRMVITQGMRFALVGVAVGIGAAYFLSKLIRAFLYWGRALGSLGLRRGPQRTTCHRPLRRLATLASRDQH